MSVIVSRRPEEGSAPQQADLHRVGAGASGAARAKPLARLRKLWRAIVRRASSSLTRRIVVLNLVGLIVLLVGVLAQNQFRQSLIEARTASLLIQGQIIAGAIAASATVDTDSIVMDPDRLLEQQAGETPGPADDAPSPLEFSLNPERVAPLLRRLVTPTGTRARIYDRDGSLTLDSRTLYTRGDLGRLDAPAVPTAALTLIERAWNLLAGVVSRRDTPVSDDAGPVDVRSLPEVQRALAGGTASFARANQRGETTVSVAVPIRRQGAIRGALLLSTQGGDIDAILASERFSVLQVFLVAASVMVVLSFLLAGAIAGPVRRLADAAERVQRGVRSRQEIPDFSHRSDEIGHLSGALRDMTHALYNRIDAIQSFAADVAHELKNPLTSLRSAVETLPVAKTDATRARLMSIIQHDVRRLDRLISDISDASRLDAELARAEAEPIYMKRLLETVVSVANERRRPHEARIDLHSEGGGAAGFMIRGHDSRLGQVFSNLFDNARSFSPPETAIRVALSRIEADVAITIDDDGPGIPPHALERVFERFYTDRPDHGFGQHSGLGLSISRQIVEAHRGSIQATNRPPDPARGRPGGARFVVRLPGARS